MTGPEDRAREPRRERLSYPFDHAIITVGNKRYFLGIDPQRPDSLLGVKYLQRLAGNEVFQNVPIDPENVKYWVWLRMSNSERRLFTETDEQAQQGGARFIRESAEKFVDTIKRPPLSILDRGFVLTTRPEVVLSREPIDPNELKHLGIIFPPGTPMNQIRAGRHREPPSEEAITEAREALGVFDGTTEVTTDNNQILARRMVKLLMSNEGRGALQIALKGTATPRTFVDVIDTFDVFAQIHLDPAQYIAAKSTHTYGGQRAVPGGKASRGNFAKHHSGTGDIRTPERRITQRPTGEKLTDKWVVRESGMAQ